jgi:hypothetical protein
MGLSLWTQPKNKSDESERAAKNSGAIVTVLGAQQRELTSNDNRPRGQVRWRGQMQVIVVLREALRYL